MATEIGKAYLQIVPTTKGIFKDIAKEFEEVDAKADKVGKSAGSKFKNAFKSGAKGLGQVVVNESKDILVSAGNMAKNLAIGVSGAIASISGAAVGAYANTEQLAGGVKVLYKDQEAVSEVMNNAANAYKSTGLSANEYMQQVTSFSASMMQALDGNSTAAAQASDKAIQAMADNASSMGTSMEDIQNAYQGFAKGNYTMLDNLKLGYGGTQEEMQRLLNKAEQISGVHYEIGNLADMAEAIGVIQKDLGIAGTAAREASQTISGAFGSTKASAMNLLSGLASGTKSVEPLIKNFVSSLSNLGTAVTPAINSILTALPQVFPAIEEMLVGLGTTLQQMFPKLLPAVMSGIQMILSTIVKLVPTLLPLIQQFFTQLVTTISGMLPQLLPMITLLVQTLATMLISNAPLIIQAGMQLLFAIAQGLIQAIPTLVTYIPTIVNAIVNTLIENIPMLIEGAVTLFLALLDAIPILLEALAPRIPEIVTTIITALIDNAPRILVGAVTAFFEIINALGQIVIELGKKLPEIWNTIRAHLKDFPSKIWGLIEGGVTKFTEWGSQIISTVRTKISEMWNNLMNRLKTIPGDIWNWIKGAFDKVKQWGTDLANKGKQVAQDLFNAIVNKVKEIPGELFNIGKNIVQGLWNGIQNMGQWVKDKISGFFGGIGDFVKGIFGIASPSKLFKNEIGKYIPIGFAEGIEDNLKPVTNAIGQMRNVATEDFRSDITMYATGNSKNFGTYADSISEQQEISAEPKQPIEFVVSVSDHKWRAYVENIFDTHDKSVKLELVY